MTIIMWKVIFASLSFGVSFPPGSLNYSALMFHIVLVTIITVVKVLQNITFMLTDDIERDIDMYVCYKINYI